jgi:putative transposase
MSTSLSVRELSECLGISERSARRITKDLSYDVKDGKKRYSIQILPLKVQGLLAKNLNIISIKSLKEHVLGQGSHALSEDVLHDTRVCRLAQIVHEAQNPAPGWKRKAWVNAVANKHNMHPSHIYKLVAKHMKGGPEALKHVKRNRGTPKAWSPEALDFGLGFVLKRPHRKMSMKAAYEVVLSEAFKRAWATGCYRSFTDHIRKKLTPQLIALRDGGRRGLDNVLPPIFRDYSDLEPFEILCGDQHTFDYWVVDDDTGAIFRPQGYLYQDLRTRILYGFWVGKTYSAHSMGLALRLGGRCFGGFKAVYTDNGKPECSRYFAGILEEMAAVGLSVGEVIDVPADISNVDPEEVNCVIHHGHHRKAIVKNAKAKIIESTWRFIEAILANVFKVPGHVKRLSSSGEEQEVDQAEIRKLAQAGKLLKLSEFLLTVVKAVDYYNKERPHRGLLREWKSFPRPKAITPLECLISCYQTGWRPVQISEDLLNLLFLPKAKRTVDRGRIRFRTFLTDMYENEALVALHGQEVLIRFDPFDPGFILVFAGSKFICCAKPVEYSSMKDRPLARRKIEEKARLRKYYLTQYRQLTSNVPDFTEYSTIPDAEATASLVAESRQTEELEDPKCTSGLSHEEIERALSEFNESMAERSEDLPPHPRSVSLMVQGDLAAVEWETVPSLSDAQRYELLLACQARTIRRPESDAVFMSYYEQTEEYGRFRNYFEDREQEFRSADGSSKKAVD